jgi:hypothetical protein
MAKTELPAWSKGVIGVLIAGGSAFALFKIYQYFGKLKEQAGQQAEIDTTAKALADLTKAGKGGSLTPVQYTQLANKLQTAFAGYGTDYNAILQVMVQIKNDYDILSLRKSYGIRKISSGRFNIASDFEGTLDQTMTEELSSSDISKLNMQLAKQGIKNRF